MAKPKLSRSLSYCVRRETKSVEAYKSFSESMDEAGAVIVPGFHVFGLTRGQFSMIDMIRYFVDRLKPARVSVWTWAIAAYEVEAFEYFYQCGDIKRATLIVDRSAEGRNGVLIDRWRDKFGPGEVRVCKNHAKIATVEGNGFKVLIRGSMNLNQNPRFEQLDISEGGSSFELIREAEDSLPMITRNGSNHEAEAATNLLFAWSDASLKPFAATNKVWNK